MGRDRGSNLDEYQRRLASEKHWVDGRFDDPQQGAISQGLRNLGKWMSKIRQDELDDDKDL